MAARSSGVKVRGLAELNRSLGKIHKEFRRDAVNHLRRIGNKVRDTARVDAPHRTGRLARTLRVSAGNRGAAVYTSAPQAGWLEWGGTIEPRGVPITIEGRHFIVGAVEKHTRDIETELGDLFDRVALLNGWK